MFDLAYKHGGFHPKTMKAQFENSVLPGNKNIVLPDREAAKGCGAQREALPHDGSDTEDSIRLPASNSDIGTLENKGTGISR